MTDQSMRGLMTSLDAGGELHRVSRTVDPKFELGAVLSLRDHGPAMLFENTGTLPVIGNLLASRRRFAQGLGIEPDELDARWLTSPRTTISTSSPKRRVHAATGSRSQSLSATTRQCCSAPSSISASVMT